MRKRFFLFAVSVLLTLAFLIGALPTSILASSAAETADTLETAEPVSTDGGGAGKTITPLTVMMYYLHGGYTTSGGVFPLRDGSDLTLMGDAAFCAQHEKSTPYNGVEMSYVGKMSDYLKGDLTDGLTALWAYRVIKAAQGLMNNSSYSALTVYQKLQAIQIAINNPDRLHSSYSNGEAGGSYTETQAKQMYALYEAIDRAARASNLQLPTEKPLTYTRTGGDYFSGANYVLATYRLNYPNVTARSVSSSPDVACSVSGDTLTVSVPADRMGSSLYYGIALSAPTQTVETIDLYAVREKNAGIDGVVPARNTRKSVLMDKSTGEPFLANGQSVTSEVTFAPKKFSGFVTVTFVFDGTDITQNTALTDTRP